MALLCRQCGREIRRRRDAVFCSEVCGQRFRQVSRRAHLSADAIPVRITGPNKGIGYISKDTQPLPDPLWVGHGWPGVRVYSHKGGLQCHICGAFFASVAVHLRSHGLTPDAYRIRFGLSRHGLIGLSVKATLIHYGHQRKPPRSKGGGAGIAINNMECINKRARCLNQLEARLHTLVLELGREPTSIELALAGLTRIRRHPAQQPIYKRVLAAHNMTRTKRGRGPVHAPRRKRPRKFTDTQLAGVGMWGLSPTAIARLLGVQLSSVMQRLRRLDWPIHYTYEYGGRIKGGSP